jgi:hypothetical protein
LPDLKNFDKSSWNLNFFYLNPIWLFCQQISMVRCLLTNFR